ncbi:MAG: prohibitin family protein [Myxococcales bacterium FL481]|nr:MAG: prohibitin family protein [Myxococcales bacterium FL481]
MSQINANEPSSSTNRSHRRVTRLARAPRAQRWALRARFALLTALLAGSSVALLPACAVVKQGELGVKRRAGKIKPEPLAPGLFAYDPILTDIIKVPVRTVNREVKLSLPSKDGLNINAEISILYRVDPESATSVIGEVGEDYEDVVVLSVFRSAAADTCAKFLAKDMYTAGRKEIEAGIRATMAEQLKPRGFNIEAVLLKSIELPEGLARAIEWKLQADQDAQRMEFTLERERLEAQRKQVEATGIRESQKIISDGLTPLLVRWQAIQAFRELATSPNSKVIITDGETPLVMMPETGTTGATAAQ